MEAKDWNKLTQLEKLRIKLNDPELSFKKDQQKRGHAKANKKASK